MNAKEKMLAGLPFDTHDADLGREREKATRLLQKLNTITLFDGAYREILRELLPNTTTECLIRPPFFATTVITSISVRGDSSTSTA